MNLPSYSVEFLPSERRLNERRHVPMLARQGRIERRALQRRSQTEADAAASKIARAA